MLHSGANGLASPRDFLTPVARFEDKDVKDFRIISKYQVSQTVLLCLSAGVEYTSKIVNRKRCFDQYFLARSITLDSFSS